MATTRSLNSDDTVFVTTFFGGPNNGRSYDFTAVKDGLRVSRTFTEQELFDLVCEGATVKEDDGTRPSFDL